MCLQSPHRRYRHFRGRFFKNSKSSRVIPLFLPRHTGKSVCLIGFSGHCSAWKFSVQRFKQFHASFCRNVAAIRFSLAFSAFRHEMQTMVFDVFLTKESHWFFSKRPRPSFVWHAPMHLCMVGSLEVQPLSPQSLQITLVCCRK